MPRIYVSSTYNDLKDCREQVRIALRKMRHEDVAMEYYIAEDQRPVDKCLKDVESCDLYLGIFAFRYGYIPTGYDKSITELEYRKAKEKGKKCIILLLKDGAPWPTDKIEFDAYPKIKALREELGKEHLVGFFSNSDDIQARAIEAIHHWEGQEGLKAPVELTNWETYRRAIFEEHRWVRLSVIGAKQDRIAHIPLTDVFVPQMTQLGRPIYEVPDEILQFRRDLFTHERLTEPGDIELLPELEPAQLDVHDEVEQLPTDISEPILEALAREQTQVILGGPGSGKSTLIHYAMLMLCNPGGADNALPSHLQHHPIPFLIELRQYVLKEKPSFIDYIVENSRTRYGVAVDRASVEALLTEDKRALIIFDGLDEVFNPAERSEVLQLFKAFAREYPSTQIIVTSRIVGYDDKELGVARFTHYTLLDFNIQQVRQFIPKWYQYYTLEGDERDAEGLVQRIVESSRLMELAGNPLLLTMMAVIYKHQDLPEQRWMLYQRCTEVLLEDWDIKRKSIDHRTLLPLDVNIRGPQKAEILQLVSMYMLEQGQEGRELNAIAYQPLMRILARYLEQKYSKSPGDAEVIAEEILNHLRERTYILAEVGERIFGFVHRTFMEYFAASYHKAEFNAKRADYQWLLNETYGAHWRKDEWQEVLLLLISMLSSQGSPINEIIEHLRTRCWEWPPLNLAFAARCLAEAGVGNNEPLAQQLITQLATSIATNTTQVKRSDVATFINEGLVALSMLGTVIGTPSEQARKVIGKLDESRSLQDRMIAWQMGLALRSRKERLDFALTALHDGEEAVRRGAIAVLEREWTGRAEVSYALLEVVRNDRVARVRQAGIMALQNAWSDMPEILDAIEQRVDDESAYTYVIWVSNYLANNWKGNQKAFYLLLRLSSFKPKASSGYDYYNIRRTIVKAISSGWREYPYTLPQLEKSAESGDSYLNLTAMEALAEGWPDDVDILQRFYEWVSNHTLKSVRWSAARTIARKWKDNPETLSILRQRYLNDPDDDVRGNIVRLIGNSWHNADDILPLIQRIAIEDKSTIVRMTAMYVLTMYWHDHPTTQSLLRDRALEESEAGARAAILMFLTGMSLRAFYYYSASYSGPYYPSYSSESSLAQYFMFPLYNANWLEPVHYSKITEGWPKDPTVIQFVQDRAVNEPENYVRKIAIQLFIMLKAAHPDVKSFLHERFFGDPDNNIRLFILGQMIKRWKGDQDIRNLLYSVASSGENVLLRMAAFRAISTIWRDHQDTLELIERISSDENVEFKRQVDNYLKQQRSKDTL